MDEIVVQATAETAASIAKAMQLVDDMVDIALCNAPDDECHKACIEHFAAALRAAEKHGETVAVASLKHKMSSLQGILDMDRDQFQAAKARLAKLEAENARLRERLAIFQRNVGLATTEATS